MPKGIGYLPGQRKAVRAMRRYGISSKRLVKVGSRRRRSYSAVRPPRPHIG